MLFGLIKPRRRAHLAKAADLIEFLDQKTCLITQKSLVGYCEVKTNLPLSELMVEQRFAEAYEVSRWEAYAAVLAGLIVVTEAHLRPAQVQGGLNAALTDIYARTLALYPLPAHRPQGWADEIANLRARLALAQSAAPQSIATIGERVGEQLYAVLPIHETLREPDRPAIIANVQFMMVGLAREFATLIEPATLAAGLSETTAAT